MPQYVDVSRLPQTPKSLVTIFEKEKLDFKPGTKCAYSNSNYNLLALIIEVVSGTKYGDFLRTEIFDRLSMHQTGHPNARTSAQYAAVGYQADGQFGLENLNIWIGHPKLEMDHCIHLLMIC